MANRGIELFAFPPLILTDSRKLQEKKTMPEWRLFILQQLKASQPAEDKGWVAYVGRNALTGLRWPAS